MLTICVVIPMLTWYDELLSHSVTHIPNQDGGTKSKRNVESSKIMSSPRFHVTHPALTTRLTLFALFTLLSYYGKILAHRFPPTIL